MRKKALLGLLAILATIVVAAVGAIWFMTSMPGHTYAGSASPPSPAETEINANLKRHVEQIAGEIGERNIIAYKELQRTAQYIEDTWKAQGYRVESQEYSVQMRKVRNLIVEIPGGSRKNEIVVIGAHYDTVDDCPGADDNTSGIAALLELSRLLKSSHPSRTVRFVAFVNEEPPWFQTDDMGSWLYARRARELHENIVAAVSLETIGMYSDAEGSQQYPAGFGSLYPSKGNFISFVGNVSSRSLVRQAVESFRKSTNFPSQGGAVPGVIPGVGWSDHWSFWQEGYPAIMVTDTALFRNPNYHRPTDKPDTLDYERMAAVVQGLANVVTDLGR